ncbi:MAG: site-specific integrase, partial [Planctomycetes bacterium]|nr:site-specific integrase [Planctomycetota bacterium]
MEQKDEFPCREKPLKEAKSSNVKFSKKYERFGEIIRYLTVDELNQFFDSIDNYYHKLMFQAIYELGCRVGEFAKIQVKHLNFGRSTIYFP